jgi:hypothetical protein
VVLAEDGGLVRFQYLGNFGPENSTENHVALALRRNGHDVVERQENDLGAWRAASDELGDFDVTLWTRTGWDPAVPRNLQRLVLQASEKHGRPVVGYHLDRWWGLNREPQVARELFFRSTLVVTADGGHDDRWAEAGVNHLWLPPAVSGAQAEELGSYREEFDSPVGFVGSWREYHEEWSYRTRLVTWLQQRFGDRFRVWEGGVRGRDLADLYASVDVVVGDSCLAGGATHYWSDRIPETLGRGGLLIHPEVDGLRDHYEPGKHLLVYELGDLDQLATIVELALEEPEARDRIRTAGRAHVLAHHTYERRMGQLVEELELRGLLPTTNEDRGAAERPLRVSMDLVPLDRTLPLVDVYWLHGSGWWDQGLIERLLDDRLWITPGGYLFVHHHDEEPTGGAAVLIVPGRYMAVADVQRILDRLSAAIVVVTSDEESTFSWWELRHPRMRLWVQTADRDGDFQPIGEGFAHDTPDELAALYTLAPPKPYPWVFAGQVTHERRQEAVAALRAMGDGVLHETSSFLAADGLDRTTYLASLAQAKLAPCPSGPETPDTFRGWEALEAGSLPILDNRTPRDDRPGYWQRLIGDAPVPRIDNWSTLPDLTRRLLADWPANSNRAQAWWQRWKRQLAWRMQDDLATVLGSHGSLADLRDLVTVVMPTSPIPSHPAIDVIAETIDSVRRHLPTAELLILSDGVRAEQQHLAEAYEEYRRQLLWASAHRWRNVLPVLFDQHLHQAGITRQGLDLVRTPLILFVEHDTPLTDHELPWDGLARAVLGGVANLVRFHHEAHVLDDHQYLMLDARPIEVEGVPMLRTIQWSQRPHLASTEFYRSLLGRFFPPSARTMIEDRMHSVAQQGDWSATKLWLYAPPGDMKRSLHLDGRGGEPKFDMVYR